MPQLRPRLTQLKSPCAAHHHTAPHISPSMQTTLGCATKAVLHRRIVFCPLTPASHHGKISYCHLLQNNHWCNSRLSSPDPTPQDSAGSWIYSYIPLKPAFPASFATRFLVHLLMPYCLLPAHGYLLIAYSHPWQLCATVFLTGVELGLMFFNSGIRFCHLKAKCIAYADHSAESISSASLR